jgi:hypothetical protein
VHVADRWCGLPSKIDQRRLPQLLEEPSYKLN